ncbi:ribosomal maturation YjgA family protein [Lacrimispora sp.]|uniref:ribosomal maturation YjgA family protein n=1 Tax=Lacrimispora sp. TaxID=2719234 RepID=UPI002F3FD0BC
MRFRLNMKYLYAFIVVFIIEVLIAAFVNDKFIRPYVGDMLVVVLIYCFIRSFVGKEVKLLPLYIFVFAALTEIGQYFHLVNLLGLSEYKIARIIIGSTFDLKDIACYLAGCTGLFLYEIVKRRK